MGSDLEKVKVFCLHGFLGLPSDWDLIHSYFMVSPLASQLEWRAVDYMKIPELGPQKGFSSWAKAFNEWVHSVSPTTTGPRVLAGYSLGGRLALQALKENPDLYQGAVFVSTNPGLQRDKDKQERTLKDQWWAERFRSTPWPELMREWNSQAVFKDSLSEPQRKESDHHREDLAQVLTAWSLAHQEDFRDLISQHREKILWVSGEKDLKFASIAMELKKFAQGLRTEILEKSSHRVLFDQPGELATKMSAFLQELLGPF